MVGIWVRYLLYFLLLSFLNLVLVLRMFLFIVSVIIGLSSFISFGFLVRCFFYSFVCRLMLWLKFLY